MRDFPTVSVVMGTYNAPSALAESIGSLLSQGFADVEFVIVNDGSPDPHTTEILARHSTLDPRLRVITKANEGLTRALVDGCAAARGEYIARQDADDVSLPGRLSAQVAFLEAHPEVVLCTCGTRVVAPAGERIEDVLPVADPESATRLLREGMRGIPAHGCCMFRRAAYERVGGYRWPFYYAQDADLWLRLGEAGKVGGVREVLYELREGVGSVSALNREAQRRFCELAQACYQARRAGRDEAPFLAEAQGLRERVLAARRTVVRAPASTAPSYRLIAARLRHGGNPRAARRYLALALRADPWSARVWKDILLTWLT
jgi:glycosyltransferase involved in cell wall biosynthesis